MTTISHRLQEILSAINQAKLSATSKQEVQLLAVSKAQSADAIREAANAGQLAFGENYVQEAIDKQTKLTDLNLAWHFIGPIQSNKTQLIAKHFEWVHGIDRLKIARRLNDARADIEAPLQVCIQVNISGEASKSGVHVDEVAALAAQMNDLPKLTLRGLMAIPEPTDDLHSQYQQFREVRECYDALIAVGFKLDTLSMGMSNDFRIAIAEGATIVRIGSALFGARRYTNTR
jgi:PLP dependent protein